MTWLLVYAFIKFWLPIVSAAGLLFKLFLVCRKAVTNAKNDISAWANTLLDNHMTHIQIAAEDASASLLQIAETNRTFSNTMLEMRNDFQETQKENLRVQTAIMTGIEVLKAKVD
jgi:hypothetical protein